jgi:hypothetical protein
MSFKLSVSKKVGSKYPIAKVVGGKVNKGKYLYLEDFKFTLGDCPADVLSEMSEKQKSQLEEALKSGLEPQDEELTKVFYRCKEWIKKKNCKIILRDGGKFQYLPSRKVVERIVVGGISGSGKSTWSANYIRQYRKQHRKNPFYVVSNLDEDDVIDKLDPVRLDLGELAFDGMTVEEVEDSLMLFDDIATVENVPIRKAVLSFQNNMLEISRHYNTYLISTTHHIQNYFQTRTLLNEATNIVLFPKSNARAIKNYLKCYENFNEDQIERCLNLNSRWFMIVKHCNTMPEYILTEKQAYII